MWSKDTGSQKSMFCLWLMGAALSALLVLPATSHAQNPDPRDYEVGQVLPSNSIIINTYLRQLSGVQGRDYSTQSLGLRGSYLLKFDLPNKLGSWAITPFDAILPLQNTEAYSPIAGLGEQFSAVPQDLKLSVHGTGMGDPIFLPSIAAYFMENARDKIYSWVASTLYVTLPLGSYDKQRLLNPGGNRWTLTPLVTVGQRWRAITLEALGSVALYGNNNDYRSSNAAGVDLTLKQKPTFNWALHSAIDLHPKFWLSLSYLGAFNGERNVDIPDMGETLDARSSTVHSLRFNLAMRIGPTSTIIAQWQEDIKGSKYAALGRFFGLRIIHAFFGSGEPAASAPMAPVQGPRS